MHCVTSSIFLSKIVTLPYLDTRTKLRLLEWKGRADLVFYVSRGVPDLLLEEVTTYEAPNDWKTIFYESSVHPRDDGHLSKLVRAVANGEKVCRPFEARAEELGLLITGDMWLKIANMGKPDARIRLTLRTMFQGFADDRLRTSYQFNQR